jgi:hypothetical protein
VEFCRHFERAILLTINAIRSCTEFAAGKNNGAVGGVQYFTCPDLCGIFVKSSAIKKDGVAEKPSSAAAPIPLPSSAAILQSALPSAAALPMTTVAVSAVGAPLQRPATVATAVASLDGDHDASGANPHANAADSAATAASNASSSAAASSTASSAASTLEQLRLKKAEQQARYYQQQQEKLVAAQQQALLIQACVRVRGIIALENSDF